MHRRDFVAALSAAPAFAAALSASPEELTLSELAKFSSRDLTASYLARIAEVDRKGPSLGAVIELNPDALRTAAALDAERRAKGSRGPLHGMPVLIKDNIDTADRMQTTAGSLALSGHRARRDAAVVERLHAAGAVILGKTNLSEWANFRSLRSVSGWSARGGQTRNPYVTAAQGAAQNNQWGG